MCGDHSYTLDIVVPFKAPTKQNRIEQSILSCVKKFHHVLCKENYSCKLLLYLENCNRSTEFGVC